MPYATAEALLWGPEMRKQHQWLLEQMRKLQCQHEAYDARIKGMEAIAETAAAATAKIRHMEQQLIAMEAVDNEEEFKHWVTEEITRVKIFTERNQNIRQKQIELEKDLSTVFDQLDKMKEDIGMRSLLRRLDLLEANREQDATHFNALEKEVVDMKKGTLISYASSDRRQVRRHTPFSSRGFMPRQQEADSETEEELSMSTPRPPREQIQAPQSPRIKDE
jgi:hypothetical protein